MGSDICIPIWRKQRLLSWALPCYASVDAMEVSDTSVLGLGTSIDQTKYDTARENNLPMNIYLTVTPLDDFTEEATKVISLTNYTESGKAFMGVKITKVNDNRFMVSWEEYNDETEGSGTEEDTLAGSTLHYVFIDGKGNPGKHDEPGLSAAGQYDEPGLSAAGQYDEPGLPAAG